MAMAEDGDPADLHRISQPRLLSRTVEASKDHCAPETGEA